MEIKNGPGIRWPDGKRIALLPTFDFDAEWLRLSREHRRPLSFADRSRGEYAIEEGLARCLRVLEAHIAPFLELYCTSLSYAVLP